jgi:hypothetical protein
MKSLSAVTASFFILLVIILPFPAQAFESGGKSDETLLEDIDAVGALAIANQWKWSKKEIKSHLNSRELVFQFPNEKVKKIPLPKEKMVIAVAPYIKETHT